jgi:V/A-type H+-transporting ATPase subunit F
VVALGSKAFVTGFNLSGIHGEYVATADEALARLRASVGDSQVALIMISDDISKLIRDEITAIRAKTSVPLIYEVPAPGSKKESVEYREVLRQILGV